jgi:hypothetical protein
MSKKLILSLLCILTLSVVFVSSALLPSVVNKISRADTVFACTSSETLENNNCTFTKPTFNSYDQGCSSSYKLMDSVCVTSETKNCTDFFAGVIAENGLCKIDPNQTSNVYLPDVTDVDGRFCSGEGYNLKRYNAGLNGAKTGPIICANILSSMDNKLGFRFLPSVINSTDIIRTFATVTSADCPVGFDSVSTKCVRKATPKTCDKNGEIFTGATCTPCPNDKVCLVTNPITKTEVVCPNGGNLQGGHCLADNKITQISYTDGCKNGYVRMYNSCATLETRTHSLGCSYFYASSNQNIKAVDSAPINGLNTCSTGGRSDFESTSITLVSNLECNGAGTAWYNYNVSFDPLVCGNILSVVGKTGFIWTAQTYSKITELHKIPSYIKVCPFGWTEMNATTCKQEPITKEYRDCNVTICGSSSSSSSSSLSSSSSSSSSSSKSNFVPIITKCELMNNGVTVAIFSLIINDMWTVGSNKYFSSEFKIENKTNQNLVNWYINYNTNNKQYPYNIWGFDFTKSNEGVYQFSTESKTYWNSNISANSSLIVGGMIVGYQDQNSVINFDCGKNITSSLSSSSSSTAPTNVTLVTTNNNIQTNNQTNNQVNNTTNINNTNTNNNWYSNVVNPIPVINITNTNTNTNKVEVVETAKVSVVNVTNNSTTNTNSNTNTANTNNAQTVVVTESPKESPKTNETVVINTNNSNSNSNLVRTGGINVLSVIGFLSFSVILSFVFNNYRNKKLSKDVRVV